MTTPAARAVMRYGAPPLAGSTRTEVMPGPAQSPPLDRVASARMRLGGLSRALMDLRFSVPDAVHRATLDAIAGEVMAVRALLAPSEVVTEPERVADNISNGCTTHHEACACGEARHRAELAALRLELTAERAVSASLRETLDAARALVAKIPHEDGCPGNRHKDCGPEGESWCCDRSRSREECLRRKADCDCHVATWRELLGVPA